MKLLKFLTLSMVLATSWMNVLTAKGCSPGFRRVQGLSGCQTKANADAQDKANARLSTQKKNDTLVAWNTLSNTGASIDTINSAQIAAMSADIISAITPEQIQIFTVTQMNSFTQPQIQGFRVGQISALASDRLNVIYTKLTATQISYIISNNDLASTTPDQLNGLLALWTASPLTTDQITFFKSVSIIQIPGLSNASVVKTYPNMLDTQKLALTAIQAGYLAAADQVNLATVQLNKLITDAGVVQNLSIAQIQALTVAQVVLLTPEQIATLNYGQVTGFHWSNHLKYHTSGKSFGKSYRDKINDNGLKQIQAFTPAQIAALTISQFKAFTPAQIAAMLEAQLQAFTKDQIQVLTAAQIGTLTGSQANAFNNSTQRMYFTAEQRNYAIGNTDKSPIGNWVGKN